MIIDEVWYEVRETVICSIAGSFDRGVSSFDLKQKILGDSRDKMPDRIIEFAGPTVDEMSLDARMSMCTALSFSSLSRTCGIVGPSQRVIDYVRSETELPFEPVKSDPDAEYVDVLAYDV